MDACMLALTLVVCLREFCHTLEIITRILREVVNRVRLCGHHTRRSLHGEVYAYGAVMREEEREEASAVLFKETYKWFGVP